MRTELFDGLGALAACPMQELPTILDSLYHEDARWFGSEPLNELVGRQAILEKVWRPLKTALPDMERRDQIFIAGEWDTKTFVATCGNYQGNFELDYLDIPATHGLVNIRYGEVHQIEAGRIVHSYCLLDMLDFIRQSGYWPIAPSVGAEGMWPAPATLDGIHLNDTQLQAGAASLALVRKMHEALGQFDGKDLNSMPHADYWSPNFLWYGPSGIGAARGLKRYQNHHSIPFLIAFPDRVGGQHYIRMGDGDYVMTGGWPSVTATHLGGGWLGLPPTGKPVGMRVMDFYRVNNGFIAENWVPIDIINILKQMGVDVFERLRHIRGQPKDTL